MSSPDATTGAFTHDLAMDVVTSDGLTLRGALRLPPGDRPAPAALLLPGSGPVDRNSDVKRMPLGVTRELATVLAGLGVASYRFDKRGAGASGGDFLTTDLDTNTEDARAALHALAAHDALDAERLLVIGHSEGALHAARLAADEPLAGVVLLSGAAQVGEDVLRWQSERVLPSLPAPARLVLTTLRIDLGRKQEKLFAKLRATHTPTIRADGRRLNAAWLRRFLDLDPAEYLRRIEVPVLAITGSEDVQAPPADVERMRTLVPGPFHGVVVDGVSHLLRASEGDRGLRDYKRQIDEPLDARVLGELTAWVHDRLADPGGT